MGRKHEGLREYYNGNEETVEDDATCVELENGNRVGEMVTRKVREHDFYLWLEYIWLYK